MARVYLGLGGNLGNPRASLRAAVARLRQYGSLAAVSSLYRTAPVGYVDQPPFLNAVVALDTVCAPQELLEALLEIERAQARVRSFRNAPRTLDLDILFYDDQIIDQPGLVVPHPRLHERAFVLVPLAEIAPALRHPALGRTIGALRAALRDDAQDVELIEGPEWAGASADGGSGHGVQCAKE